MLRFNVLYSYSRKILIATFTELKYLEIEYKKNVKSIFTFSWLLSQYF